MPSALISAPWVVTPLCLPGSVDVFLAPARALACHWHTLCPACSGGKQDVDVTPAQSEMRKEGTQGNVDVNHRVTEMGLGLVPVDEIIGD